MPFSIFFMVKVHTNFKAVYQNFTNWKTLDVCIDYNRETFRNLQVIKSMFDGVTCGNSNTSNTIHTDLFVKEIYDICPSATELQNVTTSDDGIYKRYCDFTDMHVDSTIKTTISTKETTQMSTSESPALKTEVSFTGNNFNISQSTSLENEVLSTDGTSNISQPTTLRTEVSSTDQNSRANSSQITTASFSSEKELKVKSIIYIAAPTGGVFLISLIIIFIVCLRKRVRDPEKLTDDLNMTRDTKHGKDETCFEGEMIENELYNSADHVLDLDSNGDKTKTALDDSSTAPYSKEQTEEQLQVDHQDEYSYPSKLSKIKDVRLNVAFDGNTDGDLDVKARDFLQTPNYESEDNCQYAVINKSRKI